MNICNLEKNFFETFENSPPSGANSPKLSPWTEILATKLHTPYGNRLLMFLDKKHLMLSKRVKTEYSNSKISFKLYPGDLPGSIIHAKVSNCNLLSIFGWCAIRCSGSVCRGLNKIGQLWKPWTSGWFFASKLLKIWKQLLFVIVFSIPLWEDLPDFWNLCLERMNWNRSLLVSVWKKSALATSPNNIFVITLI